MHGPWRRYRTCREQLSEAESSAVRQVRQKVRPAAAMRRPQDIALPQRLARCYRAQEQQDLPRGIRCRPPRSPDYCRRGGGNQVAPVENVCPATQTTHSARYAGLVPLTNIPAHIKRPVGTGRTGKRSHGRQIIDWVGVAGVESGGVVRVIRAGCGEHVTWRSVALRG